MIGKGNDCLFPLYLPIEGHHERLRVPCGHCINCKIRRSREWSNRLEMESLYWKDICFVTLTYNDLNLPMHLIDGSLFYDEETLRRRPDLVTLVEPTLRADHLTLFLKRLRKRLDHKIRYYAVGEYGTRFGRPHIHIMFFGIAGTREDKRMIEDCWHYGFVDVRPFFKESCVYIAGYVQKKLYGKDKYLFKLPEFMRCSQHLGERWLYDHINSIDDEHPYICMHGYNYGLPRSFRKILVKMGRLKETSQFVLSQMQFRQYKELCDALELKHTTLSEFFDQRWKNALAKEKRKNSKRDFTGDI